MLSRAISFVGSENKLAGTAGDVKGGAVYRVFDRFLPEYRAVSSVKKIDLLLWSVGNLLDSYIR